MKIIQILTGATIGYSLSLTILFSRGLISIEDLLVRTIISSAIGAFLISIYKKND